MQGIYNHKSIPETKHVSRIYNVTAVLWLVVSDMRRIYGLQWIENYDVAVSFIDIMIAC
jgi:hypothetical protein